MQDRHDVLGVHRVHAPLGLSPLQPQHVVGETQDDAQLVPLALLGLGHLGDLQLFAGQPLHQLLKDLGERKKE